MYVMLKILKITLHKKFHQVQRLLALKNQVFIIIAQEELTPPVEVVDGNPPPWVGK